MRRFRMFKFPSDAWGKWITRKQKIEERIKQATGKNKNIPMTDVMRFYGSKKMYIWDDEVVDFFLRKKGKKKMSGGII